MYHIYLFCFLQLLTDAFEEFIHALQENSKTEIGEGIMLSARAIEEFAFKYASFNLKASKRDERKENQHIGKKIFMQSHLSSYLLNFCVLHCFSLFSLIISITKWKSI